MTRRILTTLSVIGLLLSMGLWGASYLNMTAVLPSWRHAVHLWGGNVFISWLTGPTVPENWREQVRQGLATGGFGGTPGSFHARTSIVNGQVVEDYAFYRPGYSVGGFGSWWTEWIPSWSQTNLGTTMLSIPMWIPCLFFATLTWYGFSRRHVRRKRKKLGLCLKCGYDLTGLTEARCPECEEAFDSKLLKKTD